MPSRLSPAWIPLGNAAVGGMPPVCGLGVALGPTPRRDPKLDLLAEPLAGRDLAAFVAAVDAGSVQGAADLLCLTQSGATKRIQNLERRVGAELLQRHATGVVPTEAGRALYREGRRALEALWATEHAVTGPRAAVALRVAASHTVGEYLLPRWLGTLRPQAPGLHPQVDVVNSPRVVALLREHKVDIGFVEGDDVLSDFECMVVAKDEIVVVVADDHRWASREAVAAPELTTEPYVARELGSGTRAVAERRLREVGVELAPELEFASLEAIKGALRGGGFALISRLAVAGGSPSFRVVPVGRVDLHRQLVAIRPPGVPDAPGTNVLWSFLQRHCRPAGPHEA